MVPQFVTLYSLENGMWVLGLFVLVCVILIGAVIGMMFSGGDKKDS